VTDAEAGRGSRRRRVAPDTADRGSVTLFVVIFTITALFLASMLVDLGSAVNAQQRAADLAEQAARAAAATINIASLRSGNVAIDTATACQNAAAVITRYDQLSGVNAAMQPGLGCLYAGPGPRQVTVYVQVVTTPVISAVFGSFTMKAHETACAEFGITQGVAC
jgi:Putative Flp pilus-assembly TadE/G-like